MKTVLIEAEVVEEQEGAYLVRLKTELGNPTAWVPKALTKPVIAEESAKPFDVTMTPKEKEAFYDDRIAPELLRLGRLCQERGLSFVAGVEWEPDEIGRTSTIQPGAGRFIRDANRVLHCHVPLVAITITRP